MADRRYLIRLAIALAGLVLIYTFGSHGISTGNILQMVLGLGFAWLTAEAVTVAIDRFREREGHAIQGAEGEEAVGAILDRLPNVYQVQHDVPGAYGNIDHLVFRNDGAVFLIETKSHRGGIEERNGKLLVSGKPPEKDFIVQVQRNVAHVREDLRARYGLAPWIQAALVFTNARVPLHCKIGHVDVIYISYLERWMGKAAGQAEMARRLNKVD